MPAIVNTQHTILLQVLYKYYHKTKYDTVCRLTWKFSNIIKRYLSAQLYNAVVQLSTQYHSWQIMNINITHDVEASNTNPVKTHTAHY